jgi:pyruvate dehydrogenase E2 component (dihydrolipoamide acetyltransferase)
MSEIRMPSLGADMDAGTLVEWKVRPGDHVARGAIVAVVDTQKAAMEIESFVDGTIEALLVEPGTKVPVGAALARVGDGGGAMTSTPAVAPGPPATAAPATAPPATAPPRLRMSPAARKLAREHDVDATALTGTGPHGAIVMRDVQAVVAAAPLPSPRPAPPSPPPVVAPRRGTVAIGGPVRDAIAAAVSQSKREIPHYYLSHSISMKRALAWLADVNARRPVTERLLPGVLLLKAVVDALWDVPELNGFWIDGGYRGSESIHLGSAIAMRGGGVIAPALLDADTRTLDELMADLRDLVGRARGGRLRSRELTDATITVTSLGDRGCETVWGVIHPPQVAIVGFGVIGPRPWVEGDHVAVHPVVTASLAADHRVSDGHRGGLFLAAIDHHLQEPERL